MERIYFASLPLNLCLYKVIGQNVLLHMKLYNPTHSIEGVQNFLCLKRPSYKLLSLYAK